MKTKRDVYLNFLRNEKEMESPTVLQSKETKIQLVYPNQFRFIRDF